MCMIITFFKYGLFAFTCVYATHPDWYYFGYIFCFSTLRAESSLLKAHVEAQAKELENRMHRIMELEEKERIANENV